ncbi:MAG: TM2 domain-containing protein [Chitinophagaceae bacterium]|nr:TM2 domain-containing protein [Chitinophagaceae bacterium]
MTNGIHPILIRYFPDASIEELTTISNRISGNTDERIEQFCMLYRSRRRDPQIILLTCFLGFVGVAGVHRFLLNQIGMGLIYLFTAGLCFIGTIIDILNYKELALEYNSRQISDVLVMLNMVR